MKNAILENWLLAKGKTILDTNLRIDCSSRNVLTVKLHCDSVTYGFSLPQAEQMECDRLWKAISTLPRRVPFLPSLERAWSDVGTNLHPSLLPPPSTQLQFESGTAASPRTRWCQDGPTPISTKCVRYEAPHHQNIDTASKNQKRSRCARKSWGCQVSSEIKKLLSTDKVRLTELWRNLWNSDSFLQYSSHKTMNHELFIQSLRHFRRFIIR